MKRIAALVCGGTLVAGGLVAVTPASPAGAALVKACVKKKTGEMRFLTGTKQTKCKKGWKKITWNQKGPQGSPGSQGPQGSTGATGPKMVVKDGAGNVAGPLAALFPLGGTFLSILVDGGVYQYEPGGKVIPNYSPVYKEVDCSGTPFKDVGTVRDRDIFLSAAGSSARFVYRPTEPTFGAVSSFALTATWEDHALPAPALTLYARDDTGACVASPGAFNGYLIKLLREATPPADLAGPLTLVEQ